MDLPISMTFQDFHNPYIIYKFYAVDTVIRWKTSIERLSALKRYGPDKEARTYGRFSLRREKKVHETGEPKNFKPKGSSP